MTCTCGKGDKAPAVVHTDDCPCVDWMFGVLEGRESKGGTMSEDSIDLNEEENLREGGEELEEKDDFDEAVESQRERQDPDEPSLQTPTELAGGGTAGGQGLHSSGPADT